MVEIVNIVIWCLNASPCSGFVHGSLSEKVSKQVPWLGIDSSGFGKSRKAVS